jgi:hypothetical protein
MIASVLILVAAQAAATLPDARPISVTAHYSRDRGHLLRMTVSNQGTVPIEINRVWLPWGHLYTTLLVATLATDPVASSQPLERTIMMANPMGQRVTISPGQSVSGDIDLDVQFAELAKVLSRSDVVVFWSYAPRYVDGGVGERTGGWLLLPKDGTPRASRPDNNKYLDSSGQVVCRPTKR